MSVTAYLILYSVLLILQFKNHDAFFWTDPYPVTFCTRVPSKVYEKEKVSGVQAAMLDLLEHTLNDEKMSQREKRKKLKKFKAAYPDIFAKRFPTPEDEPDLLKSMSSLTRFKSVMRI